MDPLARIKERRGALSDLARHLGITRAAICHWQRVPAERVHRVAAFTGIPAHELRPDMFDGTEDVANALSDAKQQHVTNPQRIPQTGDAPTAAAAE